MIKKTFEKDDKEDAIKVLDKNDWDHKQTIKTSSEGSVGYDLRTPEDIYLPPNCEMTVDTNVVVDVSSIEEDVFVCVVPRSSAGGDKDLVLQNTVGIIDVDYNGPEDTLKVMLRRRPESFSLILDETVNAYSDKFEKLIRDPSLSAVGKLDYTDEVMNQKDYFQLIGKGAFDYNIKHNIGELGVNGSVESLKVFTVIDHDSGDVTLKVFRKPITNSPLCYRAGERFAQMFLCRYEKKPLNFVNSLDNHNRGGLGSTGVL